MEDALDQLWERAADTARHADERVLVMACDCLALGMAEMVASSRGERAGWVIAALGSDPGPATVVGRESPSTVPGAVAANSFAMHAGLADDAYLLASHPGLAVIPAALAVAEAEPRSDGALALARAIVAGYEIAGVLADLLVPVAPSRGWRVAALIAPVAAAGTAAHLRRAARPEGVNALRIAAGSMGGPLAVVAHAGDPWRIQPALAAALGVTAERAARAGAEGAPEVLEGEHGVFDGFGGGAWPGLPDDREPRILRTTFKRFGVAMYGQAIFDAFERAAPIEQEVTELVVEVSPFAAAYAGGGQADPTAVSSVAGIALRAIEAFHPAAQSPPATRVRVGDDPELGPLRSRITVTTADGGALDLRGDGSSSGWTRAQFAELAARRLGNGADGFHDRVHALVREGQIDDVLKLWRGLR